MQTHDLIQGSPDWLSFRAMHFGASEAAAMLGLSKTTTRTELLRLKKLGVGKEFSDWVQKNVLDKGHEVEALARPIIEARIGDDLYAVTCSEGELSASTDGLNMTHTLAWECKQRNAENFEIVQAGHVPPEHMPQCQQVLMVTKARKLIFTVSDGTDAGTISTVVHPNPTWFERIRSGWAQFAADLATYVPEAEAPKLTGIKPESLPALRIELKGEVSASNLVEFKDVALSAIRAVNRDLNTDQDFENAKESIKWCEDVETRLKAAKEFALSQTASIDQLFRTLDDIAAESKKVRLDLDKLVDARKVARKGEIVAGGISALREHVTALNARLGKPYMPAMAVDFGGAIKSLRTFASMQNSVDTVLANAKIEASSIADKIDANLKALAAHPDHAPLFPDVQALVLKAPDDLAAVIASRIADAEARRKQAEDAAKAVVAQAAAPAPAAAAPAPVAAPAAKAKPADPAATIKLGQINERLAPLSLSVEVLRVLGFSPVGRERAAVLFAENDFSRICAALVAHITAVQEAQPA